MNSDNKQSKNSQIEKAISISEMTQSRQIQSPLVVPKGGRK